MAFFTGFFAFLVISIIKSEMKKFSVKKLCKFIENQTEMVYTVVWIYRVGYYALMAQPGPVKGENGCKM